MKLASLTWQKVARKARGLSRLPTIVIALTLCTGCATLIRIDDVDLRRVALSALPADREAYLFVDVASSRAVLEENPFLAREILDNLEYLYAAANIDPLTSEWTVIGTGNIPVGAYSLALDFDPDWKRAKGNRWISSTGGMEVALPGPQFIIAGARDTELVAGRLNAETRLEEHPASIFLSALLEEPHPGVVAYFSKLDGLLPPELPVGMLGSSTLLVSGDITKELLLADFIFTFDSPVRARVAGLVIRTLSIAESRKEAGGIFSGARVTVKGDSVVVTPVEIEISQVSEIIGGVVSNN